MQERADQEPSPLRSADEGLDDFWRVYDANFELVYASVFEGTRRHPAFAPVLRAVTPEQIAAQARVYYACLVRAIGGDTSERDEYLRTTARAYAATGISFADWAVMDGNFTDTIAPLLVEAYAGTPGRLVAALRAMREFARRTTVILGTAYIDEKERAQQESLREREKLLASLQFERQRLGALLMRAPAAIILMRGPEHVVELANEAFFALIGPRDIMGKPAAEAFPKVVAQGLIAIFDRVLATGVAFTDHALSLQIFKTPDGPPETRIVDVVYQAIVEADGTRTGVFGHAVDVTERERAAAQVRAQFKAMPIATSAWRKVEHDGTTDFILTDYNDAAKKMTDGVMERWLGRRISAFDEGGANGMRAGMTTCLEERRTVRLDLTYRFHSTAEVKRLLVTFASVSPEVVLCHAEDTSERMKLEEQLRTAQKMEAIGRLAGGVAHDFNNILSVILGYANLVIEELAVSDPRRSDLLEITTAAERAAALTQQLLALGRRQVLQPCTIDLAETLRNLEKMLRHLLGEGTELSIHSGAGLGAVFADPTQIDQVIMNLVVNARDAMPTGGRVSIELENVVLDGADTPGAVEPLVGRYVSLAVTDTGIGMDAATVARAFEPFFTTKEAGKGTGLGLATVFGIVRQSAGDVRVRSEPGKGSTFTVYLPRVDDEPARTATARPPAQEVVPRGTETILVVEDDDQVRALACTVLRRQGYEVLEAQNGGEALLASEQYPGTIHLLLTDVVMPRMSGRDLAERLASLRPRLKVLFMSGYTDDAVVRHGVLTSGLAFLQKPITGAKLARKVRAVLDETRAGATTG
ncbi:MAG TPA: ATP-binding protein [Labilithrix sp.]|nr:ATP-binding protein [Labilithrix sp.]